MNPIRQEAIVPAFSGLRFVTCQPAGGMWHGCPGRDPYYGREAVPHSPLWMSTVWVAVTPAYTLISGAGSAGVGVVCLPPRFLTESFNQFIRMREPISEKCRRRKLTALTSTLPARNLLTQSNPAVYMTWPMETVAQGSLSSLAAFPAGRVRGGAPRRLFSESGHPRWETIAER